MPGPLDDFAAQLGIDAHSLLALQQDPAFSVITEKLRATLSENPRSAQLHRISELSIAIMARHGAADSPVSETMTADESAAILGWWADAAGFKPGLLGIIGESLRRMSSSHGLAADNPVYRLADLLEHAERTLQEAK